MLPPEIVKPMPSSVISYMHYYPDSATLRIGYVSGMVYDYKNVPERVYISMKKSFSKGTFLNRYIKDKYPFEKIN
jgi:hypothetical protein